MKIRTELSTSNIEGWDIKEVMNIIKKKIGVNYHEVHIKKLLHRWWVFTKDAPEKICKESTRTGEKRFKKIPQALNTLKKD